MDTKILSNVALGTHEDCITKYAKTNINPNRLVIIDSSDSEKVTYCSASDFPFGVAMDEAAASKELNIALLGCSSTIKIIAGAAIQSGDLVIPGADGTITPMPTSSGNYTCIGMALSGAAQGDLVEVLTSIPSQYTITA